MTVPAFKISTSIGFLLVAASLVSHSFVDVRSAHADKPRIKQTFRLSEYINNRQSQKNVSDKTRSADDRQEPKWQPVAPPNKFPSSDPSSSSIKTYEYPNSFSTVQFEQNRIPANGYQIKIPIPPGK